MTSSTQAVEVHILIVEFVLTGTKVAVKRALPPQKRGANATISGDGSPSKLIKSPSINFDPSEHSEQFRNEEERSPSLGYISTSNCTINSQDTKKSTWRTSIPYSGLSSKKMRRDFIEEMRYRSQDAPICEPCVCQRAKTYELLGIPPNTPQVLVHAEAS